MIQAREFLASFGRALAAVALYRAGHPALERAVDGAWRCVEDLLAAAPRVAFTFLGETVLVGDMPLPDRRGWEWAGRLSAAGIQRVEFEAPLAREKFEAFLFDVFARLVRHEPDSARAASSAPQGIRYGSVGLRGDSVASDVSMPTATLAFSLDEEIEAMRWLQGEVGRSRPIPLIEVETIVRSLAIAMHAEREAVLPLADLKDFDEYTTTHSLNVSVLAMGLAERLGLDGAAVKAYGIAGLLHDIGKTKIPLDVLSKPGRLTDSERELIQRHPVDGARLILSADPALDLAAVVAFEHHVGLDGGGYPPRRVARACHQASCVMHVCDVFDALRTRRPYRDAWSHEKVAAYLREGAGREFDPRLVEGFLAMLAACPLAATAPVQA